MLVWSACLGYVLIGPPHHLKRMFSSVEEEKICTEEELNLAGVSATLVVTAGFGHGVKWGLLVPFQMCQPKKQVGLFYCLPETITKGS